MEQGKYPEYILKKLRQREGLDDNDTDMDEQLNEMPPSKVFSEVCNWEGLCGYGETIKNWIFDIYGIELE